MTPELPATEKQTVGTLNRHKATPVFTSPLQIKHVWDMLKKWAGVLFWRDVSFRNLCLFRWMVIIIYGWIASDFAIIVQAKLSDPFFSRLIPPVNFERLAENESANREVQVVLAFLDRPDVFFSLMAVSIGACALLALGRWTRASAVFLAFMMVLFGSQGSMFQTTADAWFFWILIIFIVSPPDPAWDRSLWRSNPTVASPTAGLIVWLSFTVYFFAGVNKIILGRKPWLEGTALQNIAFDPSIRDPFRGMHVPYAISLLLCYYTLFQRMIVPFLFFGGKIPRLWSIAILGSMHFLYAILMYVSTFPAIGLASLLLVLPPTDSNRAALLPRNRWYLLGTIPLTILLFVVPSLQALNISSPYALFATRMPRWSFAFYYPLRWEMFASGGASSRSTWRYYVVKNNATVIDVTHLIDHRIPNLWRARFYYDQIERAAYFQYLHPKASQTQIDLVYQLYLAASQDEYLMDGGPSSLYITKAYVMFHDGTKEVSMPPWRTRQAAP